MSTVCVVREQEIYYNPDNGFGIYSCRTREGNKKVVVKGCDIPAAGSCWITISGQWIEDAKYGKQFSAEFCEVEKPITEKGVIDWFKSLKVGIGASRAKAIYAHFGENTLRILEQDPKKILEVSAVPQKTADKYLELCGVETSKQALRKFFCGVPGYSGETISRIIDRLGEDALQKITQNPYVLYPVMGYNATERLASKMENIPADFPARLSCAVFYALSQNGLSGHTCMPVRELGQKALTLLNGQGRKPIDATTLVAHLKRMMQKEQIVRQKGMFFLRHSYQEEDLLAKNLVRLLSEPVENATCVQNAINSVLDRYMEENRIQFASEQKEAILSAFLHPVSVITGGPGTGKTTLTRAILAMDRFVNGDKSAPVLLAPTGLSALTPPGFSHANTALPSMWGG